MVQRRKLQIFLSSTYLDLIEQRLIAMEAVLAAGHIPAAMEQFSPGDETAWDKICRWIDESDAYILIVGGRYGSIDPATGKSYTHREYEYALAQNKPFVSLVIDEQYLEERVRQEGFKYDERQYPEQYKQFKELVKRQHCAFWKNDEEIKTKILHKMLEWSQRDDLVGWIRGDEGVGGVVTEELARLSRENAELRKQIVREDFDGLSFDEMISLLRQRKLDESFHEYFRGTKIIYQYFGLDEAVYQALEALLEALEEPFLHLGHLFDYSLEVLARGFSGSGAELGKLGSAMPLFIANGLATTEISHLDNFTGFQHSQLSDVGRRLRNKILMIGDANQRWRELWSE